MNKDKLKDYFLEDITTSAKDTISIIGWRVIGEIDRSKEEDMVYCYSEYYILQTLPDSWPENFKIAVQNSIWKNSKLLILVSPECPEIYSVAPEEILIPIREILGITEDGKQEFRPVTPEEIMKLIDDSYAWRPESSPFTWTIGDIPSNLSNITSSSIGVYDSLSSAQNSISSGEVFYTMDTGSLYLKKLHR